MKASFLHRTAAVAATTLGVLLGFSGFAGPASAHEVSNVTVSCASVTVNFADFPRDGVMVHIVAAIEGRGTETMDRLVDAKTTSVSLDIARDTSEMFGATANVDVDVTWTLDGPQHAHLVRPLTCGEATATTTAPATTTTTAAPNVGESTTTTTSGGGAVVSNDTSSGVAAETAAAPLTASGSSDSLPATGSPIAPMAFAGAVALATGAAIWASFRRRAHTAPDAM